MGLDEKQQLRMLARQRIGELGSVGRAAASRALRQHLASWPRFQNAKCVAGFFPLWDEPDWMGGDLGVGKTWLLPRVRPDGLLDWVAAANLSDLKAGVYGIPEPGGEALAQPSPELVLIPGRAFDVRGGRLGRGKGFYDRALATLPGLRVGIAFACQILERVPMEAGDRGVDVLLTENGLFFCDIPHHPGGANH